MSLHDPFEPTREPARTLYLTFQEEARHRKGRSIEEWVKAERLAVWSAANLYAQRNGLQSPTLEQVEAAERYAMGSVDYGAKWAWGVERLMVPPTGRLGHRRTSP